MHETGALLDPNVADCLDSEIKNFNEYDPNDLVEEFKYMWTILSMYILEKKREINFSTLPFDTCSFFFQFVHEIRLSEEQITALKCEFLHLMRDPPTNPIQLKSSLVGTEHLDDFPYLNDPNLASADHEVLRAFSRLTDEGKNNVANAILQGFSCLTDEGKDAVAKAISSPDENVENDAAPEAFDMFRDLARDMSSAGVLEDFLEKSIETLKNLRWVGLCDREKTSAVISKVELLLENRRKKS